jgi:hypothetical protein
MICTHNYFPVPVFPRQTHSTSTTVTGGTKCCFYKRYQSSRCSIADPGSAFFPSRIPDPNFFHPGSTIYNEEFKYLTKKMVSKLTEIWSWLFIPDPDHGSWFFTHPGSRGQNGTGSRIRNNIQMATGKTQGVWLVAGLWSGGARPAGESCPTPAWTRAACRSGRSQRPPSKSAGSREGENLFNVYNEMKVWRHRKFWQKTMLWIGNYFFLIRTHPWIHGSWSGITDSDTGGQLIGYRFLPRHFCDHWQKNVVKLYW